MPMYEIHHSMPLTGEQQDKLAESITYIHSRQFTTPSLFVNVIFKDANQNAHYVAGKKRSLNIIAAHVRPGRSAESFDSMCDQVNAAWKEIIKPSKKLEELGAIFVLGTIIGGSEGGFRIPPAGGDKDWLKTNLVAFKKRADEGDTDFQEMLEEMKTREDLKMPNGA